MTQAQAKAWFETYAKAFDSFDAEVISNHLHIPCTIVGVTWAFAYSQERILNICTLISASGTFWSFRGGVDIPVSPRHQFENFTGCRIAMDNGDFGFVYVRHS